MHSPFLFGEGGNNPLFRDISPVQEVWAIYPDRYGTAGIIDYPDHKLSLIDLTPGADNSYMAGKVKEAINKLVERSEPIMGFLEKISV